MYHMTADFFHRLCCKAPNPWIKESMIKSTPGHVEKKESTLEKLHRITNEALERQSNGERFTINLDDIWQVLGYSIKTHAVRTRKSDSDFIAGIYSHDH